MSFKHSFATLSPSLLLGGKLRSRVHGLVDEWCISIKDYFKRCGSHTAYFVEYVNVEMIDSVYV